LPPSACVCSLGYAISDQPLWGQLGFASKLLPNTSAAAVAEDLRARVARLTSADPPQPRSKGGALSAHAYLRLPFLRALGLLPWIAGAVINDFLLIVLLVVSLVLCLALIGKLSADDPTSPATAI
jgi:hypothetical protein